MYKYKEKIEREKEREDCKKLRKREMVNKNEADTKQSYVVMNI